jgi:hypothetical protein
MARKRPNVTPSIDPGYLEFARRLYKDDSAWLAQLNREWARQESALASQCAA